MNTHEDKDEHNPKKRCPTLNPNDQPPKKKYLDLELEGLQLYHNTLILELKQYGMILQQMTSKELSPSEKKHIKKKPTKENEILTEEDPIPIYCKQQRDETEHDQEPSLQTLDAAGILSKEDINISQDVQEPEAMDISIDCDCVEEKAENQLGNLPNNGGMEDVLTQKVPIGEKVEDDRNPPKSCAMEVVLPPQVPNGEKIEDDGTKKKSLKRKMKKKKKTISPQVKDQHLVTEVLEKGDPNGKKVCKGAMVRVHMAMKVKDSDELLIKPRVFRWKLDNRRFIPGLLIGIIGMRVGDKRRFIIPPSLGYGDRGCKAGVPPNSWLVYEVKLLAHRRASKRANL